MNESLALSKALGQKVIKGGGGGDLWIHQRFLPTTRHFTAQPRAWRAVDGPGLATPKDR